MQTTGEHFSDEVSILDTEIILKEHDVKMRFIEEKDATSIETVLTEAAAAKWAGAEAKNTEALRQTIQHSRHEAGRDKTVLDLVMLKSGHKVIGRCGIRRNSERPSEFNLSLWVKPNEASSKLGKDTVTALTAWARTHLGGKGFTLVYSVPEGSDKSAALAENKDFPEIRERSEVKDGQSRKVTDYLIRLK